MLDKVNKVIVGYWPRTVALGIILLFKFAAILYGLFPFPVNTAQLIFLVRVVFGAPKSFYCCNSTVSGCDGGNRTRNIAVYTWRFSTLSTTVTLIYNHHPAQLIGKFWKYR
jgi:hypothetical protein